ncbi:putative bifunctional diguanylate cyclase/phosphodiesterase [Devosia sp.]|uniref:putative bifunctional diguanylate cyclase/phosphodiesterase n=1 Tax=Devosia sp. TaxID=1871048 RepID=UPI003BAA0B56
MRQQASLERVVATFRFIAIIGTALIGAMLALMLGTLSGARWEGGPPLTPLFGLVLCISGLLVLSRWGYLELKRELQTAAAAQKSLLDSAYRDSLTGAFTRSYFLAQLHEQLVDQASPLAYLQIDMDNLKVLNDSHGHGAGDAALVHLVKTLGTLMPQALVGRLGGDEFGIAIAGQDNRAALIRLGDEVLTTLGRPISIEGRPTRLSATIGVALWPQDAVSADELVSKADLALYKGKKNGRALTVAYDPELLADDRHKRFVERDLRAAILLNELELHYQPIYSANGRQKISHEALVRWQHPVRGRMLPGEFIGIAEQSDLIDKLGDWVLRQALRDLPRLGTPDVGINVSAVQLRRSDFAERFAAILNEAGIAGSQVVVEVTETLQLHAGVAELRNIRALGALGVRIAIDDFGAGFASLEYLRGFPFDIIKIDRSYVANLPGSKVDGLIVSALCEIARSLGVEVIAEGIETEEQLHFLERCGCTGLQGYLLARPAPLALAPRAVAVAA